VALIPVIMAGGSGSRLWPISRSQHPKQFVSMISEKTLFQETLERIKGLNHGRPIVVCGSDHRFFVAEQLAQINIDAKIILEPVARNTAPAIALAALESDPEDTLLVLSADHFIEDPESFGTSIAGAVKMANQSNRIVIFGVVPSSPHTGYGYIKAGDPVGKDSFTVSKFVEKPELTIAKEYLAAKNFYWNSGIFVFGVKTYLDELECFAPAILKACIDSSKAAIVDCDFIRIPEPIFKESPGDSIDYAVMEHTKKATMVELKCAWSDLGSWDSVADASLKDECGNVLIESCISIDSENCLVRASDQKLVALIGMDNIVVIDTVDALLVAKKTRLQEIKNIVNALGEHNPVTQQHRKVFRPWGWYDSVDQDNGFQVKRIHVNPGAKLSLQKHHHRAEHWIVVRGTAEVTCDGKIITLEVNQSTYIPLGGIHRLANTTEEPLEIIEVQSGSYLGEDDIVRFEDDYSRD
jgi:mannose-1-phosphate guanylyltransferase / mannose-6-phosphate isomerase